LEVVVVPVSDVDRALEFYRALGWRLDADFGDGRALRVVQLTPPGSPCSIIFGVGGSAAPPGSAQGLRPIVSDIEASRAELVAHGADVSEVFHDAGGVFHRAGTDGRVPGPDPDRRSYASFASTPMATAGCSRRSPRGCRVADSVVREERLMDVTMMTALLREAEEHHGVYEATAPPHHWSIWYAAYIVARENGRTPDEAATDAGLYLDSTR
jgi:catechol 2,3-dioxygenase-like lactoylglutathione lyase family enzyme